MVFPAYTVTDLSQITGRPPESYTAFAAEAITQSFLLFRLATCLTDWPTDADQASLARYAVLSMADQITIAQPYALINGSPFQSEGIGSYHYSRIILRYRQSIESGMPTGISWFDLAVEKLGICEFGGLKGGGVASDSIGVFENDGTFGTQDGDETGKRYFLGPDQTDDTDPLYWNSDRQGPRLS